MHWWPLPIALLLFAGSFAAGALAGRRGMKTSIAVASVCTALVTLRILWRLHPRTEYAVFPWDWYVPIRAWWVFVPAQVVAGVGAVRMSTWGARVGVGVFAAALLLVAGQRLFLTLDIDQSRMEGRPDGSGVCPQTTDYTCGAAAAATVLAQIGVPTTEREMAVLCDTNAFMGTDEFGVAQGLRRKLSGTGRRVEVIEADWDDLRSLALPAAATVRFTLWVDHWVVVFGVIGEQVIVGDPTRGRQTLTRAEFERRWRRVLVTIAKP